VRLIREGQQPIARVAKDLSVSTESVRHWIKQADLDEGLRTDGLPTEERHGLVRLCREN
jgi:transposase